MPWFRVDDKFYSHPKFVAVSMAARGLWVSAGSWCTQNLTDGWLPESVLPLLTSGRSVADLVVELESADLWTRGVNGWQFHDWTDWQWSKDRIEKQRLANRERQQKWAARGNDKRWGDGEPSPEPGAERADYPHQTNAVSNALLTSLHTNTIPPVVQVPVTADVVSGTDRSAIQDRDESKLEDASFTLFWNLATRKTGKGAARKAFTKALTRTTEQQLGPAWVKANAAWKTWPDKTRIPHPSTWLNQDRWDDDPPSPHRPTTTSKTLTALAEADQMEGHDHDPSRHAPLAHAGRGLRPHRPAIGP